MSELPRESCMSRAPEATSQLCHTQAFEELPNDDHHLAALAKTRLYHAVAMPQTPVPWLSATSRVYGKMAS